MVDMQLSTPSYLKHAFKDQHNLVLLFGAACFSVAFASSVPLLVGAAGELAWLLIGPRLPAFRDWVDRQLSAQYLGRSEAAIEGALGQLTDAEATRFLAFSSEVADLGASILERFGAREQQLGQHGLLELRRTFLDYLFLGQRVATLSDGTSGAELEKEAAQLQQSYAAERELTLRMTIRNALAAVQRRLSQQSALSGVERNIEFRLVMLEKALPYLRGRLVDPGLVEFTREVEQALNEVGSAETLELTVDEIFDPPGSGGA